MATSDKAILTKWIEGMRNTQTASNVLIYRGEPDDFAEKNQILLGMSFFLFKIQVLSAFGWLGL